MHARAVSTELSRRDECPGKIAMTCETMVRRATRRPLNSWGRPWASRETGAINLAKAPLEDAFIVCKRVRAVACARCSPRRLQ